MDWCAEGASTYPLRRALFVRQKETLEAEMAHMRKVLDMLQYKCWYYEQAMRDGSEDGVKALIPDRLPEDIRRAYDSAHSG